MRVRRCNFLLLVAVGLVAAMSGACGGDGDGDVGGTSLGGKTTVSAAPSKVDRSGKPVCELLPVAAIKASTRYTQVTVAQARTFDKRAEGGDLSNTCGYRFSEKSVTSSVFIGVYQWNETAAAKASYDAEAQKLAKNNPAPVPGIGDSAYVGKHSYGLTEFRALLGDTVVVIDFSGATDDAGVARDIEGLKQFAPTALKALAPLLPS